MSTSKPSLIDEQFQAMQDAGNLAMNKELVRFKQDCRKRALEYGIDAANRSGEAFQSKKAMEKAQEYYEWLTQDLS